MGKIVKTILATEDNDPMNLLGTSDVFSPTKHIGKNMNKKNKIKEIHTSKKIKSEKSFSSK